MVDKNCLHGIISVPSLVIRLILHFLVKELGVGVGRESMFTHGNLLCTVRN